MLMSYSCPVYLTQERRNKVSVYSYNENHVINIIVPASKPGDHWLKRGVALFCQIGDWLIDCLDWKAGAIIKRNI